MSAGPTHYIDASMSDHPSSSSGGAAAGITCPRCGDSTAGRYCSGCGAPLRGVRCTQCDHELTAGARFCNECGAPVGAVAAASAGGGGEPHTVRLVGIAGVVVLLAFVAGEVAGRRAGAPLGGAADPQASAAPASLPAGMPAAPDISSMSPEERASRLFNRVMSYSEQGKLDSARFFAPMAVGAYQMLGPPDLHARYDVGEIYAAVGDAASARAEADTILAAQPTNLLGLVLAARAADALGDPSAAAGYRRRLVAAAPAERAKGLKEYAEHARDIDDALRKAGATP